MFLVLKQAHELFYLYDVDSSGAIDATELMDVLRLLGENPTPESVA